MGKVFEICKFSGRGALTKPGAQKLSRDLGFY